MSPCEPPVFNVLMLMFGSSLIGAGIACFIFGFLGD